MCTFLCVEGLGLRWAKGVDVNLGWRTSNYILSTRLPPASIWLYIVGLHY